MTTVRIKSDREIITGFTVSGHSGYAEHGSDIVCAAVTSAVRLTECILNDEILLNAKTEIRDGYISLTLGSRAARHNVTQTVLSAFVRLIRQYTTEYPENIQIMEDNDNA